MIRKRHFAGLQKPAPMIHERTIMPSGSPSGNQSAISAAPYFGIRVDTTDAALVAAGVPIKVVLFDSSEGHQLEANYLMPNEVVITGQGVDYQFLLNDTATNSRYISMMKMTVTDAAGLPLASGGGQFAEAIQIFQTVVGRGTSQVDRLFPDMGIHEGQFQTHINTFEAGIQISNQIAIVLNVLPGIKLDIALYQGAEMGRDV